MNLRRSSPLNIGMPWPGSKMNGIFFFANCSACLIMPVRPSGDTMPIVTPFASVTLFFSE